MKRKSRRLAVALAVSGLVAAGTFTVSQLAHADVAGTCMSPGAEANCTVTQTIAAPTSITVSVKTNIPGQFPFYQYTLQCTLNGQTTTTTGSGVQRAPYTQTIPLSPANPDSCTVTVHAQEPSSNVNTILSLEVDFTTGPVPGPPPPPVSAHVIKVFGGKCLDDKGNSSANRTRVIIWTCNTSDPAQAWTFSAGELVHNGKCANDQGNGGSGSKVILWTCNRSPNELWFHSSSNNEFILRSLTHGLLCLTDPGYSTHNGTQLIVSACRNTSNQHWSLG